MLTAIWLVLGLALLGFLSFRATRVWLDSGRYSLPPGHRISYSLLGAIFPDRYWWSKRLSLMSLPERDTLLASETQALGLAPADSLTCPLCDVEVPRAWTLTSECLPTVAPGPIDCPACDFRLDACRHCAHFLPGASQSWGEVPWGGGDISVGRCGQIRTSQPVEQACAPSMARRLRQRGYERIRAPLPIVDSFLPPDSCRNFVPDRKRMRQAGLRWPDRRRTALLRLMTPSSTAAHPIPEPASEGSEEWLN